MKWFILIFIVIVGYAILTGNMGGAKHATGNYNRLLTGQE